MKILYLTFYFEPDLSAGSFRNTAVVNELSRQLTTDDAIHVVTTQPNRYRSFRPVAPVREQRGNLRIDRVSVPVHSSGFLDQIWAFLAYAWVTYRLTRRESYDLVVASSSRLFTAWLGSWLARPQKVPLFLDVRDLFRETLLEMLSSPVTWFLQPVLRAVEQYTFGYARHINLVSDGFRDYFRQFRQASYSYFTNGIDAEFVHLPTSPSRNGHIGQPKTILYAGNIGAGQALHTLIPQAARLLGSTYRFVVIGDGGAKLKLQRAIRESGVNTIELRSPVSRRALLAEYDRADYLLLHLANLDALKRVLPSKLFEYGATDKPILAGVSGYAAQFVRAHLTNYIQFKPGDVANLADQLRQTPYRTESRSAFVRQFSRRIIVVDMASCIRSVAAGGVRLEVRSYT